MQKPSRLSMPYTYTAFIATQNDKMMDAINAFDQIINDMPRSQAALDLAKQGLDSRLRTERIIKDNIAWAYINAAELGHDSDPRKTLFEKVPSLTFDELGKFQRDNIAGRHYNFAILADLDDIDIEALRAMGRVVILTTEDIFGY